MSRTTKNYLQNHQRAVEIENVANPVFFAIFSPRLNYKIFFEESFTFMSETKHLWSIIWFSSNAKCARCSWTYQIQCWNHFSNVDVFVPLLPWSSAGCFQRRSASSRIWGNSHRQQNLRRGAASDLFLWTSCLMPSVGRSQYLAHYLSSSTPHQQLFCCL